MGEDFPSLSGKWININNPDDSVNVINNIIDGDQMIIITDKGNMTMDEFSSKYIKEENEGKEVASAPPIEAPVMKAGNAENAEGPLVADSLESCKINKISLMNQKRQQEEFSKQLKDNNAVLMEEQKRTEAEKLLDKLFSKYNISKSLSISCRLSEDFPVKEISMMMNIFDIKIEEISDYIIDKILSRNIFSDALKKALDKINKERNEKEL